MSVLKQLSVYTFLGALTGGISFLLLPVLTRFLTPADYGILSIFTATVNFFTLLIPVGMGYMLNVYIIQKEREYYAYLSSFVRLTCFFALLLSGLGFICMLFIDDFFGLPYYMFPLLSVIALMVIYVDTVTNYFVFKKKVKHYAVYYLSKFTIEIGLVLVFVVVLFYKWEGRIAALFISLFISSITGMIYLYKKKVLRFSGYAFRQYARGLLAESFPLVFMGLSMMVMNLSDRFFLEKMKGIEQTGMYNIAATVASIIMLFIGALVTAFRPQIYATYEQPEAKNKLTKLFLLYTGILISAILFLALATPFIFRYAINIRYAEAEGMVYPLLIALFFWGAYNFINSLLMYKKSNRILGYISFVAIIISLVGNYVFIHKFGTIGASYATLFVYAALFTLSVAYFFVKRLKA